MNLRVIERLARLVAELDLSEIEVKRLGERVRVVKRPTTDGHAVPTAAYSFVAAEPAHVTPPSFPASPTLAADLPSPTAKPPASIKAPLVGTFYRAPAPDAPPYVEEGQIVDVGQTVCIIEAMKIMNEIHSDIRGRITAIPVGNAEPVEFGQVLIELDTRI